MTRLLRYFRDKPIRLFYASLLIAFTALLTHQTASLLFEMELFAKLVHDPDHRMQQGDKHFSGLNSDNIRSPHEATDIKDSDFNIIFLGDSFVYGFLMASELSPPAQMEKLLREKYQRDDINVINFGWTSSSPILSLRLLQDLGARYKPDLVLIAVDMSDYRDDWFYASVLEQRGFYRYIVQFPRIAYLIKKIMEVLQPLIDLHSPVWGYSGEGGYFVAKQPLEKSSNLFDQVYHSLLQLNDYTHNTLHVPFVVLLPPRHWQYTDQESPQSWENGSFDALGPYALENYRYFDSKRSTMPFPWATFLEDFRNNPQRPLTFAKDSHWNKHGALFFAERTANYCEQLGLFKTLESAQP
ncbi:MAG: SGNH/GDSL hydrolase family protein [Pseudomonadales bacterium]|nr:SGNH/GDSL hydrolase family protein [Pseudomonadales bacterium]